MSEPTLGPCPCQGCYWGFGNAGRNATKRLWRDWLPDDARPQHRCANRTAVLYTVGAVVAPRNRISCVDASRTATTRTAGVVASRGSGS